MASCTLFAGPAGLAGPQANAEAVGCGEAGRECVFMNLAKLELSQPVQWTICHPEDLAIKIRDRGPCT